MKRIHSRIVQRGAQTLVLALLFSTVVTPAQTTAFSYQGKLTEAGNPANGNYDLQFKLFDTLAVGTGAQQGSTLTNSTVAVSAGVFTVMLDFGANVFAGAARYLEIGVRSAGSGNPYAVLAPRQAITPTPYAIRTLSATAADSLSAACAGCVTSNQIQSVQGSQINGAIPVASVPAGSGNYVQNTTTQQASANFNIAGNGTAAGMLTGNLVNATTQYNLAGNRVLGTPGTNNLFAGLGAGQAHTTATNNAFFGAQAGAANTTAGANAFFGARAGAMNTASGNSFFGASAGFSNTTGFNNAFFGTSAGQLNTTGKNNSFFGLAAGGGSPPGSTGNENSFFGFTAGQSIQSGSGNSFFGGFAGVNNSTGSNNTLIGSQAGLSNTTGNNNTLIGTGANVSTDGLTNATAIGANAQAACSNCLVLGSINGVNEATADTNVGIGITALTLNNRLEVDGGSAQVAVLGIANAYANGFGVLGWATVGSDSHGIHGLNTGAGYAGFFSNKVYVGGALEKAAGSFKIDHPLDPANKYLYHSFVESPDMLNIYNGNVTTDANGEAVITLPDWFESLNRDFRYQLTVIGQFAQAIIAEEIKDNRFKLKTNLPQVKVSWQVTGIRQDAWANSHRIPSEELKPEKERGTYLHPEVFGQPEEKSVEWAHHPELMRRVKAEREKARRKPESVATKLPPP